MYLVPFFCILATTTTMNTDTTTAGDCNDYMTLEEYTRNKDFYSGKVENIQMKEYVKV